MVLDARYGLAAIEAAFCGMSGLRQSRRSAHRSPLGSSDSATDRLRELPRESFDYCPPIPDPARSCTLAALAREAGCSRTVLVERFPHALGVAPMTDLLKWRMQIAAGLLSDGNPGLARVSAAVGYGSEEAFSRAFKRCTGHPPGDWRLRHDRAGHALPDAAGSSHPEGARAPCPPGKGLRGRRRASGARPSMPTELYQHRRRRWRSPALVESGGRGPGRESAGAREGTAQDRSSWHPATAAWTERQEARPDPRSR